MKKVFLLGLSMFCLLLLNAQTQTIRGKVVDKETRQALANVSVKITTATADSLLSATADANGEYAIAGVSVGRHNLLITLQGYKEVVLQNIIVSSAKEVILNIEMEEMVMEIGTARIVAKSKQNRKQ